MAFVLSTVPTLFFPEQDFLVFDSTLLFSFGDPHPLLVLLITFALILLFSLICPKNFGIGFLGVSANDALPYRVSQKRFWSAYQNIYPQSHCSLLAAATTVTVLKSVAEHRRGRGRRA